MTEKISELYERLKKPIIRRILKQFGDFETSEIISPEMSNSEIFRRLSKGNGAGKPHCGKYYVRQEGKTKNR